MKSSMEINPNIQAQCANISDTFYTGVKLIWGTNPANWLYDTWDIRSWQGQYWPVAFIFTVVKPCSLRCWAAATTSEGLSPPIQPYTLMRCLTLPPSNCHTGTPSLLPLMSHNAMSRPESALCETKTVHCLVCDRHTGDLPWERVHHGRIWYGTQSAKYPRSCQNPIPWTSRQGPGVHPRQLQYGPQVSPHPILQGRREWRPARIANVVEHGKPKISLRDCSICLMSFSWTSSPCIDVIFAV